jgi:hypothetical protein
MMGMDVYGKNPSSEVGRYFRNNVWWWRPLWDYVVEVAPHLTEGVDGHMNGGDGLGKKAATRLTKILTAEIEAGRTAQYATERAAKIEALPDEPCGLCHGTGTRTDKLAKKVGCDRPGGCNACEGKGTVRPWVTNYPFNVENAVEFRDFVAASGGFEIW